MRTPFECHIDSEIIKKFKIALMLNEEEQDEVIRSLMMQYVSSSFFQAYQSFKETEVSQTKTSKNIEVAEKIGKLLDEL